MRGVISVRGAADLDQADHAYAYAYAYAYSHAHAYAAMRQALVAIEAGGGAVAAAIEHPHVSHSLACADAAGRSKASPTRVTHAAPRTGARIGS